MVTKYIVNRQPAQCDIVKKGFATPSSCPNNPANFTTEVQRGLEAYGVKNGTVWSSVTPEGIIQSEINAGRPMLIRYGYYPNLNGTGHMVVIKGHNLVGSEYRVTWNNPGTGTVVSGTYSYLVNNSTWKWTHSRTGLAKK
jgi:hypothetical protein